MQSAAKTPLPGCPIAAGTTRRGWGDAAGARGPRCDPRRRSLLAHRWVPFVAWNSRVRSAARRRTEADRGLAACSAARRLFGAAGEQPQVCRVLGELDGQACGLLPLGPGGEHPLGDPVLERVVGQDRKPAADGQRVDAPRQGAAPRPTARR